MYYSVGNALVKGISSFAFLSFLFLFLACKSEQQVPNNIKIPPLQAIAPVKNHYQQIGSLSPAPMADKKQLDEIKFPKTKYAWLIWYLAPDYISKAQINKLLLAVKPPANSSQQTQAELDFLLDLQTNRTKEQTAEILRMHEIVYIPMLGMQSDEDLFFECYELFGKDFDPSIYPHTKKLLHNSMKGMRVLEFTAKNHFMRARPRQLEAALTPLAKMGTSSFASGHTLWAYLQAYLFAELIPHKRKDFLDLAYTIGYSRELLGVHYPSDEEASRKLSHAMLKIMWENPQFKQDFVLAQQEWKN